MLRRCILAGLLLCCVPAYSQSTLGRLLSGDLVAPADGVWAWYELTDAATGNLLYLRQAIVGVEGKGEKAHYWLELQVRPQVGFATTYKMLLRGPSANPSSIELIYYQTGTDPVQKMAPASLDEEDDVQAPPEPVGQETIETPQGAVLCNHYVLEDKTEIWLSDAVPPMGIVRLKSPDGELKLQGYGRGGQDAQTSLPTEEDKRLVRDFGENEDAAEPTTEDAPMLQPEGKEAPQQQEDEETQPETPRKKNFGGRGKR